MATESTADAWWAACLFQIILMLSNADTALRHITGCVVAQPLYSFAAVFIQRSGHRGRRHWRGVSAGRWRWCRRGVRWYNWSGVRRRWWWRYRRRRASVWRHWRWRDRRCRAGVRRRRRRWRDRGYRWRIWRRRSLAQHNGNDNKNNKALHCSVAGLSLRRGRA